MDDERLRRLNWAPVTLPPEALATARRLSEALLDLLLLHPEDWQRYADGSYPHFTNERDADGNIIVRWNGEHYASLPSELLSS
jgi:hypothetical protein